MWIKTVLRIMHISGCYWFNPTQLDLYWLPISLSYSVSGHGLWVSNHSGPSSCMRWQGAHRIGSFDGLSRLSTSFILFSQLYYLRPTVDPFPWCCLDYTQVTTLILYWAFKQDAILPPTGPSEFEAGLQHLLFALGWCQSKICNVDYWAARIRPPGMGLRLCVSVG